MNQKTYTTYTIVNIVIWHCLLMMLLVAEKWHIRPSISDYAYSDNINLYSAVLFHPAFMFYTDGMLNKKRWYNVIFGASLFVVGITPYLDFPWLHYIGAGLFFIGSASAFLIWKSKKQIWANIIFALLIIFPISFYYLGWFGLTLFLAELIAIAVRITHHLLEVKNKIE